MTVLVFGDGDLVSEFTITCQYGGRDYVQVRTNVLTTNEVLELVRTHQARVMLDVSKPFAGAELPSAIQRVSVAIGMPLLRAVSPSFSSMPRALRWSWVDSFDEAVRVAQASGGSVLAALDSSVVTADLGPHVKDALDNWVVRSEARSTDNLTPTEASIAVTPPVKRALRTLRQQVADCVVAADTGEVETLAILEAADLLELPVVIVRRPPGPDPSTLPVNDLAGIFSWLRAVDNAHG